MTMKPLFATCLIGIQLITGIASTTSAGPQFGSRVWWEAQIDE